MAKPTMAVVGALATAVLAPAHAQPNAASRVTTLTEATAKPLALQLRSAFAPTADTDDKCYLGFVYAHVHDLPSSAAAAFFLPACFAPDGSTPPPFAVANADAIDALYRAVTRRLQASDWSEMTLTSNLPSEVVTIAGWENADVRVPASLWLPAGTYRATFAGNASVRSDVREFVVAKSQRGVVMIEHALPPATPKEPTTTTVSFEDEQPEAGSPTVVINNKHKNLVPDRFVAKPARVATSPDAIADPFATQTTTATSTPRRIAIVVGAGLGAHFDATANTRLGPSLAGITTVAFSPAVALDVRAGFASTGGTDAMQRSSYAWSFALGPRWQFAESTDIHPFATAQLGVDVRSGDRATAAAGLNVAAEIGAMLGSDARLGFAVAAVRGLTRLDASVATGIGVQLRARIW